MGKRLKPLTDTMPKCLTEINGKSILVNALDILRRNEIQEVILVVGYLAEKVKEKVGDNFRGVKIKYVENKIYDKTNNIYSLWLARDYLNEDILLIEGDIIFEEKVIRLLLESPYENCTALDHYTPLLDGLMVSLSEDGLIKGIYLMKDQEGNDFDYSDKFKTVNIHKLSKAFLVDKYLKRVDEMVSHGDVNCFYEEALKDILDRGGLGELFMKGVIVKGCKWFEIDTLQDIMIAERVFKKW